MLRLLKIEWSKIYYYKPARIFTILYFLLLALIGSLFFHIFEALIGEKLGVQLNIIQTGFFDFPVIWQNMAYLLDFGKIFLAIIIITIISNEYSNNTIKQNMIDGLSKKEFLYSKLFSSLILITLSTLIVFITSLVLGLKYSQSEASFFDGIVYVFIYFVTISFFLVFCTFLSFLTKKSSFAILSIIIWYIAEGVLITFENFVRNKIFKEKATEALFKLTDYLPLTSSSKILKFNFKLEGFVMGMSVFEYTPIDWKYVLVTIIYILLFALASYKLLQKRDL